MRLTRLISEGYRNLEPLDLSTDTGFVVFHGPNAQGKTNVLEAVHLLCTLKPLRGRKRTELIRWGGERASIVGWVDSEGITRKHRVDLSRDQRQVELDGKRVSDLAEYFSDIRCICFTPQDFRVVAEEPKWRRRWLDRAAFTAAPAHLAVVRNFRRALAQKGAALRQEGTQSALLDALDHQVATTGAALVTRRVAMLEQLDPHVRTVHSGLVGGTGSVRLRYRTQCTGTTEAERAAALLAKLAEVRPGELRRRTTLAGPQSDDVVVELDGRAARTWGSRGQVRSLVLSLKLAEMIAARERGEVPLFLIDDVSSELDRDRTRRLVEALADLGAQVWATTTDPDHMQGLPPEDTLKIGVDSGSLTI